HQQVAALAARVGHAFAFDADELAVAEARRNLDGLFPVKGLDFVNGAKERVAELNVQLGREIRPFFFELRIGRHVHFNVEVAWGAAGHSLAGALEAYHFTALDARRHDYLYLLLLFIHAFPAAGRAFFFGHLARSAAEAARLHHGDSAEERICRLMHFALPAAVLAREHLTAHDRAAALACVAYARLGQEHAALGAKNGFFKSNFEVNGDVAAAARARSAGVAGEEVAEDVAPIGRTAELVREA